MAEISHQDDYGKMLAEIGYTHEEFYKLMDALDDLAVLFKHKSEHGGNAGYEIERYCGICDTSQFKSECAYAKRAALLFVKNGSFKKILEELKKVDANVRKDRNPDRGSGQSS